MSKLLKSLLAAAALLAVSPATAAPLPPQCNNVCDASSACSKPCALGTRFTTCGVYGVCAGAHEEPSDEQTSVTMDEPALVSSEETQAAEPPVSAES